MGKLVKVVVILVLALRTINSCRSARSLVVAPDVISAAVAAGGSGLGLITFDWWARPVTG
jgi:hypothetical protein